MQVFIIGTPQETAEALDHRRLHKQLIECSQILKAAYGRTRAWASHPCTRQYKEHTVWLKTYMAILSRYAQGLPSDPVLNKIAEEYRPDFHIPEYFDQMKRRLYTKDPEHYEQWEHLGTSYANWYYVDGIWTIYENGKILKHKIVMSRTINDITVEQLNDAAQKNAEQYDKMFQKAARAAFIEGVLYSQKYEKEVEAC